VIYPAEHHAVMAAQDRDPLALAASQMRAVLSFDAVTMRDPSGLKAAEITKPSWPRRIAISLTGRHWTRPPASGTRYELTDFEWAAIKPMLPNKPRGVPRASTTGVSSTAFFGSLGQARHGAICLGALALTRRATIALFAGDGLASGTRLWVPFLLLMTPPFK
jgi:hypothetical protein